jgi:predicted negative regulator of RcsB-dependent stress response
MDADTRHQLKQNEFAQALRQLVDFSDRRTLAWLIVIIAVALGYGGYKFWGWRQQAAVIGAFQTLRNVNATDAGLGDAPLAQLRQLIAGNTQPALVAFSRLQLARGLEARGRDAADAPELRDAETQYKAVLDTAGAPNHVKAAAAYRLGLLYETMREFAKAREAYSSLGNNPLYRGSPFIDLAARRLDQLDELAVPVKFEPGVKPLATTQPASQPAVIPRPGDDAGEEFMGPPVGPIRTPASVTPTGRRSPPPTTRPSAEPSRPQQP